MTNLISIILSLVILLVLIYIKDTQARRYRTTEFGPLYYKLKKQYRILLIISLIVFFIAMFIDYKTNYYDKSWLSFISIVINGLSVAIITLPISILNLYNSSFHEKERISYTKYIVTNIYDLKSIYRFNKAGIKVIIVTEDDIDTKIKKVSEKDFNKRLLVNNLVVKTTNKKFLKDLEYSLHEYRNLNRAYEKITSARGSIDNLIRTIKYTHLTYIPILLLYIDLVITGFPVLYNLLLVMFMKLITTVGSEYVYKKMPFDSDLMTRKPFIEGKYVSKQEILFIILTSICTLFCYALPYQYIIYEEGTNALALTLFFSSFLFNNIFITYALYSESAIVKNIIKSLKNLRVLLFIICLLIITILINFIYIFGTKNMGLHNYFSSIFFGLLPLLVLEIVKFARYVTIKGNKKNERKNNKKYKRS